MALHSILELLNKAAAYLAERGIENARLDAEVLLSHVLGMERIQLYVNFDRPLEPTEVDRFRQAVARRAKRVPVAYITGCKEFYSLELAVSPAVLIPRPETEVLVERTLRELERFSPDSTLILVELGTGSGAISIALAYNFVHEQKRGRYPGRNRAGRSSYSFHIYANDISREALQVAASNARRWGVDGYITWREGDLYRALPSELKGQVDAIVSNPPYIPSGAMLGLAPEIRLYEPALALDGGPDGLHFHRRILSQGRDFLRFGGFVALEIGHGQGNDVMNLARQYGYTAAEIQRDYANKERVAVIRWMPEESTPGS